MKSPVDIVKGRIVDVDKNGMLTIRAYYPDYITLLNREYRDCTIHLQDGRKMSDKQRKTCYALLRDISKFTGMGLDRTKEELKVKFLTEELGEPAPTKFSLSDASVSMVCAFQNYLVNFMLDYDIPSSIPLLDFVDDIQNFLYACLASKKCCICGKRCDIHHYDRVGMGRDRTDMIHEGMKAQPLCREHHIEVDQIGQISFDKKYHLNGGVVLDKKLCKIYGLKTRKELEGNGTE